MNVLPAEMTPRQVVSPIERHCHDIEVVTEPREAVQLVKQADAIKYLCQKADMGEEMQDQAAEMCLRARRRAGELLAENTPTQLEEMADDLERLNAGHPPQSYGGRQASLVRMAAREGVAAALQRHDEVAIAERAGLLDGIGGL